MDFKFQQFRELVLDHFPDHIDPIPQPDIKDIVSSPFKEEVKEVYASLGGKADFRKIRLPQWPITLDQNTVVFLDDQLHFNRYRMRTLRAEIYQQNYIGFKVEKYRSYSRKKEAECLKSGVTDRSWTHKAAEVNFGPGSETRGDLQGEGAPAWKFNAFVDYLLDLYLPLKQIMVIRISIWDELMIGGRLVTIKEILTAPNPQWNEALVNYLKRRMPWLPERNRI
ncbi:DUF7255 family protein [Algivirga pacifica]|uniref:Uncharacterized protein n=1 Tax=Algivirga pacifica TaxID=1162670 RepID=A0ABP9DQM7_9BACT